MQHPARELLLAHLRARSKPDERMEQKQPRVLRLEAREAELLQVKPSTLNEMMKRLGIHTKSNAIAEEEEILSS